MLIGGGGWRSRAARHLFPASLRESGIDVGAVKNRKRALKDAISGQDFAVSNVGIADGGLFEMDVADLVSGKGAFFPVMKKNGNCAWAHAVWPKATGGH